ncbi:MAG: hypothetical protein GY720_01670 [bacterium]|nr:hypothetical protein [bacterium]
MQHDQNAPTPGEAQNTPANGGTPNAPGDESQPKMWTPELEAAARQAGFSDGYGKGKGKGEKEALSRIGLGEDWDSTTAALDGLRTPPEKPKATPVADSPQYQDLAAENLKLTTRTEELESELSGLRGQADEARLTKIRLAANAKGVGEAQMRYFLRDHQEMFALDDDGDLVALSKMKDGTLVSAGKDAASYIDEVIAEAPFLLASQGKSGAGSQPQPVHLPQRKAGDYPRGYDTRNLSERMRSGK